MRHLILVLFCAITAVAQITNINFGTTPNDRAGDSLRTVGSKINTNFAWLNAAKGARVNGVQVVSSESALTTTDPTNGYSARVFTGTTSADWVWNAFEGGADVSGERVRPTNYVTGSWIKTTAWATSKSLGASKAAALDSSGQLTASTATKQQVDNTAMQVASVAALQNLSSDQLNNGQFIQTAGYSSAGDGGGTTFYFSSSSTASTNTGTVFKPVGSGRFLWAGVDRVTPKMFGAKGDGSTDDTAAMQAFVDYVASAVVYTNPSTYPCYIPDGVYLLSSVTNNNGVPIISSSGSMPGEFGAFRGVVFMHKANANAPMWVVQVPNVVNRSSPVFQGITFWGRASQNLRNAKAVVSSSTRTNLVVATNNLPADPFAAGLTNDFTKVGNLVTGIDWPYFGWARLGAPDGTFMGHALIQSINYGNGAITIVPQRDNYETRTTGSGLLQSGDLISFAGIATEDSGFADSTDIEAGSSGWAAIHITSPNGQTGSGVTIRNCWIRNFHTGVRVGNILTTKLDNCRFDVCEFASVAAAFPGNNRDGRITDVFTYGGYSDNPYTTTPAYTITGSGSDRNSYQNQTFGFYGWEASGIYRGILVNNSVYGGFGELLSETQFDDLLIEATIGSPLLFTRTSSFWTGAHFNSLAFRTYNGNPSAAATNRSRHCIEMVPMSVSSNWRIAIGKVSYTDFTSAGLNKFTTGLFLRSTDTIEVGLISNSQGVTALDNATGSIDYGLTKNASGNVSEIAALSAASVTATNSVSVGTTSSGNVATFTGGTGGSTIAQFVRSGQPTVGIKASAGFLVSDETSGKNIGRFSWTGSSAELVVGSPSATSPVLVAVAGEKASGTDVGGQNLYINAGQGTGSGSVANAQVRIRTPTAGSSGTSLQTMTDRAMFDSTSDPTLLPMWINHNGTLKQVQLGAADSGGAGFRMIRISN